MKPKILPMVSSHSKQTPDSIPQNTTNKYNKSKDTYYYIYYKSKDTYLERISLSSCPERKIARLQSEAIRIREAQVGSFWRIQLHHW